MMLFSELEYNIDDSLRLSKETVDRAITDYSPYAIIVMMSGGHDSLLAYHVAKILNAPITHFMHGITGTGILETTDFARKLAERSGLSYLEANAKDNYEQYVLRKGFFGIGHLAHAFSYHLLKRQQFRSEISRNIRQGQRNRNVLLINGARKQESINRKNSMIGPIKKDGSDIWVNIVNDWSAIDRNNFLNDYEHNPVYDLIHRSGECLCGTMQSWETKKEVSYWFPKWGEWLSELEKRACQRGFCWKWGEDLPPIIKARKAEEKAIKAGQTSFLPMCHSCKISP